MYFYMIFVQRVLISCFCLHFPSWTFWHITVFNLKVKEEAKSQKLKLQIEKEGPEPTWKGQRGRILQGIGMGSRGGRPGSSLLLWEECAGHWVRVYLRDGDGNYKAQLRAIAHDLKKHPKWQSKAKMWHISNKKREPWDTRWDLCLSVTQEL